MLLVGALFCYDVHMFKTRNYAVTLGIFSLSIIGGASAYTLSDILIPSQAAGVVWSDGTLDTFSATITKPASISRADKLAEMRKKIAATKNIFAAATAQPEEIIEPEPATSSEVVPVVKGEKRCATYQASNVSWSSVGVKIEEVEGARLVYREGVPTMVGSTSVPTRNTLAQLPLRSTPISAGKCIGSDVIGISKNGALMRNNEVLAYSGFGSLVGYALDGFPIYSGAHDKAVDACGGAIVAGQYRYYIGSDQETIISCYSGTPISL